jgi:hypothetical protein
MLREETSHPNLYRLYRNNFFVGHSFCGGAKELITAHGISTERIAKGHHNGRSSDFGKMAVLDFTAVVLYA